MALEYYEVSGVLCNGSLVGVSRQAIGEALRRFPDGPVVVRIEKAKRHGSSQQRRYWFGVVVPAFCDLCGYEKDEMHEVLKYKLNPQTKEFVDPTTGEVSELTYGGSTQRFTTHDWMELIRRAHQLGAEWGIYIPDPGEVAA